MLLLAVPCLEKCWMPILFGVRLTGHRNPSTFLVYMSNFFIIPQTRDTLILKRR